MTETVAIHKTAPAYLAVSAGPRSHSPLPDGRSDEDHARSDLAEGTTQAELWWDGQFSHIPSR